MASDICPLCDNKSNKTFWICCDSCDVWHHGSCVGLTKKAVEKLNTWHCRKCVSEKAMSNNATAHEAAVVPPIKTANSSTYFLTVCVCNNDLKRNTTTSNIRVSAQCGVCHNHFHVHCIRVKASNGTVLCPNCSCQNYDDVDQIQETAVDTHETTNISTVALPTQAVATTLLSSALPTQLGSEEIIVSEVPSTPPIPSESEEISVSAAPSTPPIQSESEETSVSAVPSPTPPTQSGSGETTVLAIPSLPPSSWV